MNPTHNKDILGNNHLEHFLAFKNNSRLIIEQGLAEISQSLLCVG